METKYEKIRAKRNEMYPPVLELGTDILIPQNSDEMYNYKVIDVLDSNSWLNIKKTWEGNKRHNEVEKIALCRNCAITNDVLERYNIQDIKILGTPLTINDILLMIENKGYSFEWIGKIKEIHVWKKENSWKSAFDLDLTKSIKDQTEETLSAILSLFE